MILSVSYYVIYLWAIFKLTFLSMLKTSYIYHVSYEAKDKIIEFYNQSLNYFILKPLVAQIYKAFYLNFHFLLCQDFLCVLNNNRFRLPFKIIFCVLVFLVICLPALISFFMVYCCFLMAFQAKLWWFAILVFFVVFWGGLYRRFSR